MSNEENEVEMLWGYPIWHWKIFLISMLIIPPTLLFCIYTDSHISVIEDASDSLGKNQDIDNADVARIKLKSHVMTFIDLYNEFHRFRNEINFTEFKIISVNKLKNSVNIDDEIYTWEAKVSMSRKYTHGSKKWRDKLSNKTHKFLWSKNLKMWVNQTMEVYPVEID